MKHLRLLFYNRNIFQERLFLFVNDFKINGFRRSLTERCPALVMYGIVVNDGYKYFYF